MDRVSEVPDGMREDARETWPSHDLIESWLGDSMYDFQFRPGEDTFVASADGYARRGRRFAAGLKQID